MTSPLRHLTAEELEQVSSKTIEHYQRSAPSFWEGTKDHDVSQNIDALLRHIPGEEPHRILDVGCGPGRDLITLRAQGHEAVGLDGALAFVQMARRRSGCEVLNQDLLQLDLPAEHFDGVFANACLFHVPSQELGGVLDKLWGALKPGGVLFCSNPHGPDVEEWHGARYGCYLSWPTWRRYATESRFLEVEHYYRPAGRPREQQPWLASVWRKTRR